MVFGGSVVICGSLWFLVVPHGFFVVFLGILVGSWWLLAVISSSCCIVCSLRILMALGC